MWWLGIWVNVCLLWRTEIVGIVRDFGTMVVVSENLGRGEGMGLRANIRWEGEASWFWVMQCSMYKRQARQGWRGEF